MSNIGYKWIKLWKALLCGSFLVSIFQDHLSIVAGEGNIGKFALAFVWEIWYDAWDNKGFIHMCLEVMNSI